MDLTRKPVDFQGLQNDLTGAARSGRYPDARNRARTQESRDGICAASAFRCAHAVSLSGCHIRRCSPLSSGCQYGLTFIPIFSCSALQLTTPAMTLTPTASAHLAMA